MIVDSVVDVAGVPMGAGSPFVVIAGPCRVESRAQLVAGATVVARSGGVMMHARPQRPRVRGREPVAEMSSALRELRRATGLRLLCDVSAPEQVDAVAGAVDMLRIGSGDMRNEALLRAVAASGSAVLLTRGISAPNEEWFAAADRIIAHGNPRVVLCERGIRHGGSPLRVVLDLADVPVVRHRSHLPVVVDLGHAGSPQLTPALSLAAAASGADGCLVDVHGDPRATECRTGLSLTPADLACCMDELARALDARGRRLARGGSAAGVA